MTRIVIGLTGNIATGKSTVMQLAADRGAATIDADKVVHAVLRSTSVKDAIRAAFGDDVFDGNGEINRRALGTIVFNDPAALRKLEGITHPATRAEILRRIDASSATVVMLEAILLLEGPLHTHCDTIWVTTCTRATQIARLQRYRGFSREDAARRVDAQAPQAEKVARADVVIDTEGSVQDTERQFERAWRALPAARGESLPGDEAESN